MGISRGHHFVPQGYLKNFTDPHNRDQLVVFDRAGKRFTVGTSKVAKKRDFDTVRGATPPDVVEAYYAEIEDHIAIAIRDVQLSAELAQKNLDYLIALMTILHVRSQKKRLMSGDFMSRVARQIMQMSVRDEKTYQSTLAKMKAEGHAVNENVSYETMKEFIALGQYSITTEVEAHINLELSILPDIENVLRLRNWCLLVAPTGSHFVTSDHPSNLFATTGWRNNFNIGLGLGSKPNQLLELTRGS